MIIDILCSDPAHPVNQKLQEFIRMKLDVHSIDIKRKASDCLGGDILFLIGCTEIVRLGIRSKYQHTVVCHASDLPVGRGWSPYVWEILNGKNSVVVSLLNAEDAVDSGDVWKKLVVEFTGYELFDEVCELVNNAQIELMDWMLEYCGKCAPQMQIGEPTYWPRRTPEDSQLDVDKTIRQQFNLLRVCDQHRFPAFFVIDGNRYDVILKKRVNN